MLPDDRRLLTQERGGQAAFLAVPLSPALDRMDLEFNQTREFSSREKPP